jgi:2-polyprenyl-3-methyl-5-hydroxy-6-metoxy-1,4-benzoquinol methylase
MRNGCRICEGPTSHIFSVGQFPLYKCKKCGLEGLSPQPDDQMLGKIYSESYFLGGQDADAQQLMDRMKALTAERYLRLLRKKINKDSPRLIEIGCGGGDFLVTAKASGFLVAGLEINLSAVESANDKLGGQVVIEADLFDVDIDGLGTFDCCVLLDVLEHVRDPVSFLKRVRRLLGENGICFIVTPSLDSWSARLLRRYWIEYKAEHLFYFNRKNIEIMLVTSGFRRPIVSSNWKTLNLGYIDLHMQKFYVPIFSSLSKYFVQALPKKLRDHNFRIVASGMNVVAFTEQVSINRFN